jgi:hypothetical protein
MGAMIRAGNRDGFVKVLEEALDPNSFMIATRCSMKSDAKELTGSSEDAVEGAASVHKDETTHANFQQNLLEQKASKFMGVNIVNRDADDELSEITHGREEMTST